MELTQKSVYPVHKLDVINKEDQCAVDEENTESDDINNMQVDYRIQSHYFDKPRIHKLKKHECYRPVACINKVQKHTLGIQQEQYVYSDSKVDPLTKTRIYEPQEVPVLVKLNAMLKQIEDKS